MNLYGDGGLVSSAADLAHFARALLHGEIFDEPATLDTMLEPANDPTAGMGNLQGRPRGYHVLVTSRSVGHGVLHVSRDRPDAVRVEQQGALEDIDLNPLLVTDLAIVGRSDPRLESG